VRRLRSPSSFKVGVLVGLCAAAALVRSAVPSRGDEESDELALVAVFDGIDLWSRARAFAGGSLLAWFGGINVDLTDADPAAGGARLNVHTLCGGIELTVPADWQVESRVKVVVGGANAPKRDQAGEGPVLVVDGLVILGGVNVTAAPPVPARSA
jgi:hypothetical protein